NGALTIGLVNKIDRPASAQWGSRRGGWSVCDWVLVMQTRVVLSVAALAFVSTAGIASASGLPAIKATQNNGVPACVTPGRLMALIKARTPDLDTRFDTIATEYRRHGEELGMRWDYAFYQMVVETGGLSFKNGNRNGSVRPVQNNF